MPYTEARVLVDARSLSKPRTGIGVFTAAILLEWLASGHQPRLLTRKGAADQTRTVVPNAEIVELATPFHLRALSLARSSDSFYFSPDSLIVPTLLGRRATATVHDLVPLLHPETQTRRVRLAYRLLLKRAMSRVGAVITPGEATKRDLLRIAPKAPAEGVPYGVRPFASGGSLPPEILGPYVLYAGTVEPRKHVPDLIEAFLSVAPQSWSIVVAGGLGWLRQDQRNRLAELGESPRVHVLGYVDDATLGALLNNAAVLAYPSSYEGFGLPVLEAMAATVPVLTTTAPAIAEVAGEAAHYVDLAGDDPYGAGLRQGLTDLINDHALRSSLSKAGAERAQGYRWDVAAQRIWQIVTRRPE